MKLKNVYNELIKLALDKTSKIIIGDYEEKIGFTPNGSLMYFIPEKKFIFDIEKILNGREKMNLKAFREIEKDAKPVNMPGEIKKLTKSEL